MAPGIAFEISSGSKKEKPPAHRRRAVRDLPIPGFVLLGERQSRGVSQRPMPWDRHPGVYEFLLVASGTQALEQEGRLVTLKGGDLLVMGPGEKHRSAGMRDERCHMIYFQLKAGPPSTQPLLAARGEEAAALRGALGALAGQKISTGTTLVPLLKGALDLLSPGRKNPFALTRGTIHLTDFLLQAISHSGEKPKPPSKTAEALLSFIRAHAGEALGSGDLCRVSGLSPSTLTRLFKREVGMTAPEFILRERMVGACRRLESSREDITRIAAELGFSSSQYFATVFQRFTGFAPGAYRMAAAKKTGTPFTG